MNYYYSHVLNETPGIPRGEAVREVMIMLEQELFSELLVQCFFYFGHIQGPGTICQAFCKLQQYSRILPLLDFNCQCIKVHDMCW